MLIYDIDHYLYTTKSDIFVLRLVNQSDRSVYDRDNIDNKNIEKNQLEWFDSEGIEYAKTVRSSTIEGWTGLYLIKFLGNDDPAILRYCKEFETSGGISKYPDKFQLYQLSYDEWVDSGELEKYSQYLIDREDPNWLV